MSRYNKYNDDDRIDRAAADWIEGRGWKHVETCSFTLRNLALHHRSISRQLIYDHTMPHQLFDHAFFFKIGRTPAAIVSHLYSLDPNPLLKEAIIQFAREHRLKVEFDVAPRWWHPSATSVLWLPEDV